MLLPRALRNTGWFRAGQEQETRRPGLVAGPPRITKTDGSPTQKGKKNGVAEMKRGEEDQA